MSGATTDQLVRVAQQSQLQVLAVRDRAERALALTWQRTVAGPDDGSAAVWIAASVPLLTAAQSSAAGLALAFVSGYVSAASGSASPASGLTAAGFLEPRGVPLVELLMRPMVELRSNLAAKVPYQEAFKASEYSVARIGSTDPMLSYRAAATESMAQNPRVVGYRRVPDAKACSFCLLVATQRYHDSELMAMHPHCGCTVAPIVGTKDPGHVLDRGLADRLVAADPALGHRGLARDRAREIAGSHLQNASDLTAVHQHGELGPVLYPAGQHFTAA